VAPAGNQSGSGAAYAVPDGKTRLLIRPLAGEDDVYCVHRVDPAFAADGALQAANPDSIASGSPVDATALGLKLVMPEAGVKPDLVVSGANFGENLSDSIPHSGTVMNAAFAARRGVPAIAISVGVRFEEARSGFGSTLATFPKAADFLVRLIARLEAASMPGQPLLPPAQPLNVNYPALAAGETAAGVRFTVPGTVDSFTTTYTRNPDGLVLLGVGAPERENKALANQAETPAFVNRQVTISPLAVDFRLAPKAQHRFERAHRDLTTLLP
jgi:5'-nucleotidase